MSQILRFLLFVILIAAVSAGVYFYFEQDETGIEETIEETGEGIEEMEEEAEEEPEERRPQQPPQP